MVSSKETTVTMADDFSFSAQLPELLAAELLNPTKQCLIVGRFHVKEFDAHADTRFENTNYRQGFDDLIFARQSCANPASHFESLASANKCASDGKIGGYAANGRATFEIK
jgi:hypothetical protein